MKLTMQDFFLLTALASSVAFGAQPTFRDKYNVAAKDMVPALQITSCATKVAKTVPGKAIIECDVQLPNTLLSLDSMNNRLTGVWLMLDSSQLNHPSDLMRTGGMLLRAARGSSFGDYLAVAADAFKASQKIGWKQACVDDKESSMRFCVSSDDRRIFDLMLTPTQANSTANR